MPVDRLIADKTLEKIFGPDFYKQLVGLVGATPLRSKTQQKYPVDAFYRNAPAPAEQNFHSYNHWLLAQSTKVVLKYLDTFFCLKFCKLSTSSK